MSLATLKTKVEQLIEKATDEELWYEFSETCNQTIGGAFSKLTSETLPRMNPINVPSAIYWCSNNQYLRYVDFYLNLLSCKNISRTFLGCSNLEYVEGIYTAKATTVHGSFYRCSSLHTIGKFVDGTLTNPLDFTNVTETTQAFQGCTALRNISFVAKSIKVSLSFADSLFLTVESKQSIFDGLAPVETAQTLTLHADAKILQSQVDSANAKGWTVAGGTIVSEEEYYG